MNRALARFVKEKGGKHDPYPSAQDLVATLKEGEAASTSRVDN